VRRSDWGSFAHGCPPAEVQRHALAAAEVRQALALQGGGDAAADVAALALPRLLLEGIEARYQATVARIERSGGRWRLLDTEGGPLAEAARLVVTAPAPQSAALLAEVQPAWSQRLQALRWRPNWSLLLALPADVETPDWRAAGDWLARVQEQMDPSDAVGPATARRWVLQLSDAASKAVLEARPEAVLEALHERLGVRPGWCHAAAHRWRFARVIEPLPDALLLDDSLQLAVCGDAFAAGQADSDLGRCLASAGALISAWAER
jgi:predicted NAD/FAD-dependent oxidoreductase